MSCLIAEEAKAPSKVATSTSATVTPSARTFLVGHKCILAKIPFFKALLSDNWREGYHAERMEVTEEATFGGDEASGVLSLQPPVAAVNIDGFIKDGVRIEIFARLIDFVYTGIISPSSTLLTFIGFSTTDPTRTLVRHRFGRRNSRVAERHYRARSGC